MPIGPASIISPARATSHGPSACNSASRSAATARFASTSSGGAKRGSSSAAARFHCSSTSDVRSLAALVLIFALGACTPVFFQPTGSIYSTPGIYGIDYQPVDFRATDGTALFAWFMPARGEAHGTVLYLHGNAQNISAHFPNVAWMPAAGFNVLAIDYRGYGGSGGKPSLSGVQLDIDAAMRVLLARRDVNPERIIVFGQSLGGALATHFVAHSPYRSHIKAVIADSPFSDYRQIAQEKLADLVITWPLQWLPTFTVN